MTMTIEPFTHWLFTDLDGTLIPLDGEKQNVEDLQQLKTLLAEHRIGLTFVTGRHLSSALAAIPEFDLPIPQWVISDVGTRISEYANGAATSNADYRGQLLAIIDGWNADKIIGALTQTFQYEHLELQEAEKQSPLKISFYTDAECVESLANECRLVFNRRAAPLAVVSSVDPFTGDGLIDVLPAGVDKAYACKWLAQTLGLRFDRDITYAGDSGNDLAALTSGCRAIVVGNADTATKQHVAGLAQVWVSSKTATSAVVEGVIDGIKNPEHR